MHVSKFDYGDTFIHKKTRKEVKVSERNGELVFITEDGDVSEYIDIEYYE